MFAVVNGPLPDFDRHRKNVKIFEWKISYLLMYKQCKMSLNVNSLNSTVS